NLLRLAKITSCTKPDGLSDQEWIDILDQATENFIYLKPNLVPVPIGRIKNERRFNLATIALAARLQQIILWWPDDPTLHRQKFSAIRTQSSSDLKMLSVVLAAKDDAATRIRSQLAQTDVMRNQDLGSDSIQGIANFLSEQFQRVESLERDIQVANHTLPIQIVVAFDTIGGIGSLSNILINPHEKDRMRMFNHKDFRAKLEKIELAQLQRSLHNDFLARCSDPNASPALLICSPEDNWEIISRSYLRQKIEKLNFTIQQVGCLCDAIPENKYHELIKLGTIEKTLTDQLTPAVAIKILQALKELLVAA
ncbi:MAG TPA: hypothetical protein VI522_00605, partial [Gammaproteobacteria bacterium]|nr:hypothetical protein [Gammaproteobacteria bacterium]